MTPPKNLPIPKGPSAYRIIEMVPVEISRFIVRRDGQTVRGFKTRRQAQSWVKDQETLARAFGKR